MLLSGVTCAAEGYESEGVEEDAGDEQPQPVEQAVQVFRQHTGPPLRRLQLPPHSARARGSPT
jgi:hypothetical protein